MRRQLTRCPGLLHCAIILVAATLLSGQVLALPPDAPAPDRFEQRQQYQAALQLIRSNHMTRYRKLKPQLQDYPLYPYLEYNELTRRMSWQTRADILAFTEQYQDTPLAAMLEQRWLGHLAGRGQWRAFLAFHERFKESVILTRTLACYLGQALYRTGRLKEARAQARALWLVNFSQPDTCDPVFKSWRDQGGLTGELAWQRLSLSIRTGPRKLSRYLLRFIDKQDKSHADNFRRVQSQPRTILRTRTFRKSHIRHQEIILYGVTRLAKTDPESALKALQTYQPLQTFDPDALEAAYAQIGIFLAQKDLPVRSRNGARSIVGQPLPVNLHRYPQLIEAGIRQALRLAYKEADSGAGWARVLELIKQLPTDLQMTPRWRYWQARALNASRESDQGSQQARRCCLHSAGSELFTASLRRTSCISPTSIRTSPNP